MTCVEGFMDSGAGTTLWDLRTAERSGLPLRTANEGELGTYWGAGGDEIAYAGMIEGPIEVAWAPDIRVIIPFIMVIQTHHPLVLWGTDVMKRLGKWAFRSLGYSEDGMGIVTFSRYRAKGKRSILREIPLVSWPV